MPTSDEHYVRLDERTVERVWLGAAPRPPYMATSRIHVDLGDTARLAAALERPEVRDAIRDVIEDTAAAVVASALKRTP